jgi:uncharacterized protein (UPF0261 family)
MKVVALVGTLDTKGQEYDFLRRTLLSCGVESLLIDVGVLGEPAVLADISRAAVAVAAASTLEEAANQSARGQAIAIMAKGGTRVVLELAQQGRIDGILGLGGTGGTTLVTEIMRALPLGFPKLMVSTVASGDTRPYVGTSDITMMYSVLDIAGINKFSSRILANAAGAIAGMVAVEAPPFEAEKPVVVASMFGLTTPAVEVARTYLEENGYEVLVFHATGAGGASMEALIDAGLVAGVLDMTTTELADELVGGVFPGGPTRLTAAGRAGIPQVVSLGALDMVNFGAPDTVPAKFEDRLFYKHNASVTLMRTSVAECKELGARIADRLSRSTNGSSSTVFIPEAGFSGIDAPGQVFHDPAADADLIQALRSSLVGGIKIVSRDVTINDPEFALEMAKTLHADIQQARTNQEEM